MPPDVVARAFEPFFTTKGVGKGTGLGLSMLYGFIKQSGGHVELASIEGRGTTVRLFLPDSQTQPAAGKATNAIAAPVRGNERILVVEDNAELRSIAVRQIRDLGYEVAEASNGLAALEILRTAQPVDLLFTDIMMPGGLDGPTLAREALKLRPQLKVLFTSGFADGRSEADFPLLQKPYRKPELAVRLRAALEP
jgi:CheY-like chemotaxis protein